MSDEIVIREATERDAPVIAEYNRRLAEETESKALDGARLLAGVRTLIAEPARGRYYIAESGSRVVGQLLITFEWSDWRNGDFWWIQSVYVDEAFRRRGVFRGLYRHVETLARETGKVCGLRLYVEDQNEAAFGTYRSLGMSPTSYRIMESEFE